MLAARGIASAAARRAAAATPNPVSSLQPPRRELHPLAIAGLWVAKKALVMTAANR